MAKPHLSSLSIFFPFYNDSGTVLKAIDLAYTVGRQLTKKLEVIAIHGGDSRDPTWYNIQVARRLYPQLKVINKKNNHQGYGVIKVGLRAVTKDWVFYTDGDLQYNVKQLTTLVRVQNKTQADIVNGYKQQRSDAWYRQALGTGYSWFARTLFSLPIQDVDCDFRLIRTRVLRKTKLRARSASVLPELIWQLKRVGAHFEEVPLAHYPRLYGGSNYKVIKLLLEKVVGDLKLWRRLHSI